MSNYKDELCSRYANVSFVVRDDGEAREMRTYHLRALEMVTELEAKIGKLEKDNKILESEVKNWLHHYGMESRENYELREEKKVLYSAIRALTK